MWYNNKKNIYIRIMREEYKLNFCKKLCSLFLATLMVFSIAACAGTSQTGAAPEEVIQPYEVKNSNDNGYGGGVWWPSNK